MHNIRQQQCILVQGWFRIIRMDTLLLVECWMLRKDQNLETRGWWHNWCFPNVQVLEAVDHVFSLSSFAFSFCGDFHLPSINETSQLSFESEYFWYRVGWPMEVLYQQKKRTAGYYVFGWLLDDFGRSKTSLFSQRYKKFGANYMKRLDGMGDISSQFLIFCKIICTNF